MSTYDWFVDNPCQDYLARDQSMPLLRRKFPSFRFAILVFCPWPLLILNSILLPFLLPFYLHFPYQTLQVVYMLCLLPLIPYCQSHRQYSQIHLEPSRALAVAHDLAHLHDLQSKSSLWEVDAHSDKLSEPLECQVHFEELKRELQHQE